MPGVTLPPTKSGVTVLPNALVLIVVGALAIIKAVDSVRVVTIRCARGMVRVVGHRVTSSQG